MHVVDAEALPEPDFVCKCRAIQFTCCGIPSDNDPFVCRRLAGIPAYKSPEDQLATARKALEQIAALTDVYRSHPGSNARMSQSMSRLIPSRMNVSHGDPR